MHLENIAVAVAAMQRESSLADAVAGMSEWQRDKARAAIEQVAGARARSDPLQLKLNTKLRDF